MADPMSTIFGGRRYPARSLGGQRFGVSWKSASGYDDVNKNPLLGFTNKARYQSAGTGEAVFIVHAGPDFPGLLGTNLSITVSAASSTLLVSQVGEDITIRPASGGSHASDVVAAFNAAIPANVAVAELPKGSAGGTNISASQAKRFFTSNQIQP